MRINNVEERFIKKLQTEPLDYCVNINGLNGNSDEARLNSETLRARIAAYPQHMLNIILHGIPLHDFVRVVINNQYLQNSINMPLARRKHISGTILLDILEKMLNSNVQLFITGLLEVNVIHVSNPKGGRSKDAFQSFGDRFKNSISISRVKNKDQMCLTRAIVIGKAITDKDPKYASIRDSDKMQTRLARALCVSAGVNPKEKAGIEEVQLFQDHLKDYQTCVVSKEHLFGFIFKGP